MGWKFTDTEHKCFLEKLPKSSSQFFCGINPRACIWDLYSKSKSFCQISKIFVGYYKCGPSGKNKTIITEKIYLHNTVQKTEFSVKDLFSKCEQICSFLRIWSQLLKKSYPENFIFCAVYRAFMKKVFTKLSLFKNKFCKCFLNTLLSMIYLYV